MADVPSVEDMPSLNDILKMKYGADLLQLCRSIGVQDRLATSFHCHKSLLQYYHDHGLVERQDPVRTLSLALQ